MIIGHLRGTNEISSYVPLIFNSSQLAHFKQTKFLEIVIDEGLTWGEQFKKIKEKVTEGL